MRCSIMSEAGLSDGGGSRVALMASDERELEGTLEGGKREDGVRGEWNRYRGSFNSGYPHGVADRASELRTVRILRTLNKGGEQCKILRTSYVEGPLTLQISTSNFMRRSHTNDRHSRAERSDDDVIVSAISANGLLFCSAAAKCLSSSLSFGTALQAHRVRISRPDLGLPTTAGS